MRGAYASSNCAPYPGATRSTPGASQVWAILEAFRPNSGAMAADLVRAPRPMYSPQTVRRTNLRGTAKGSCIRVPSDRYMGAVANLQQDAAVLNGGVDARRSLGIDWRFIRFSARRCGPYEWLSHRRCRDHHSLPDIRATIRLDLLFPRQCHFGTPDAAGVREDRESRARRDSPKSGIRSQSAPRERRASSKDILHSDP